MARRGQKAAQRRKRLIPAGLGQATKPTAIVAPSAPVSIDRLMAELELLCRVGHGYGKLIEAIDVLKKHEVYAALEGDLVSVLNSGTWRLAESKVSESVLLQKP